MAEISQNNTAVTVDATTPRIEFIKMPDGVVRKVGISLEEHEAIVDALSDLNDNMVAINTDVEDLKESELVTARSLVDLDSRITALESEISELKDMLQNKYMAYYEVDSSKGIGENNVYTR